MDFIQLLENPWFCLVLGIGGSILAILIFALLAWIIARPLRILKNTLVFLPLPFSSLLLGIPLGMLMWFSLKTLLLPNLKASHGEPLILPPVVETCAPFVCIAIITVLAYLMLDVDVDVKNVRKEIRARRTIGRNTANLMQTQEFGDIVSWLRSEHYNILVVSSDLIQIYLDTDEYNLLGEATGKKMDYVGSHPVNLKSPDGGMELQDAFVEALLQSGLGLYRENGGNTLRRL